MQNLLFEVPTKEQTKDTCKTCKFIVFVEYRSGKRFHYCILQRNRSTHNGLLKIKCKRMHVSIMNKEYKKYLLSDDWAQLKIDLFKLRGYKCERCSNKSKLQVHHKTYKNIFKEEPTDLIILCEDCHKKEHPKYNKVKPKIKPKAKKKVKAKKSIIKCCGYSWDKNGNNARYKGKRLK